MPEQPILNHFNQKTARAYHRGRFLLYDDEKSIRLRVITVRSCQPAYVHDSDFIHQALESILMNMGESAPVHGSDCMAVTRVFHSDQSTVFRVQGSDRSLVVKISRNVDDARREHQVHNWFRTYPVPVPTPQLLTADDDGELAWLVFEDNALQTPVWARHRALAGVTMLARLHNGMPPSTAFMPSGLFASHTPGFHTVLHEVTGHLIDSVSARMTGFGWRGGQGVRFTRFLEQAVEWGRERMPEPKVLCHGDIHWGNLMWSGVERTLYMIDWSFVHENEPYFDLFQMLDATSPTVVLQKPIRRLDALHEYYAKRTGNMRTAFTGWARGYVLYATVYLLWIVSRIEDDCAHDRFSQTELARQWEETLAQLMTLHQDFRRLSAP